MYYIYYTKYIHTSKHIERVDVHAFLSQVVMVVCQSKFLARCALNGLFWFFFPMATGADGQAYRRIFHATLTYPLLPSLASSFFFAHSLILALSGDE